MSAVASDALTDQEKQAFVLSYGFGLDVDKSAEQLHPIDRLRQRLAIVLGRKFCVPALGNDHYRWLTRFTEEFEESADIILKDDTQFRWVLRQVRVHHTVWVLTGKGKV